MASDIWSVACCVIEIVTGDTPFTGQFKTLQELLKLMEKNALKFPEHVTHECREFLMMTLKYTPESRATIDNLMKTGFVRGELLGYSESSEESMMTSGKVSDGRISHQASLLGRKKSQQQHPSYQDMMRKESGFSSVLGADHMAESIRLVKKDSGWVEHHTQRVELKLPMPSVLEEPLGKGEETRQASSAQKRMDLEAELARLIEENMKRNQSNSGENAKGDDRVDESIKEEIH
jgi:serine/threonine protein kinase